MSDYHVSTGVVFDHGWNRGSPLATGSRANKQDESFVLPNVILVER